MTSASPVSPSARRDDRATRLTRKIFIGGMGLATLLALWRFLLLPLWVGTAGGEARFEALLVGTAARIEIPLEVGKSFLQIRREFTRPLLVAELKAVVREGAQLPAGREDLLARLRRAIAQDHLSGRMVEIKDRTLSLTEARLAALRALLGPAVEDPIPRLALFSHVQVGNWGPQSTPAGVPFNLQPDGSSALWFQGEGFPEGLGVTLADQSLTSRVQPALVTAGLAETMASELLSRAGAYPVRMVLPDQSSPQLVGFFHVLPAAGDRDYLITPLDLNEFDFGRPLEVLQWGPTSTPRAQGFNLQPDGSSAFWLRIASAPSPGTFLALDGMPLPTNLSGSVITAALVRPLAARILGSAGTHRLQLVDPVRRLLQNVGDFEVR